MRTTDKAAYKAIKECCITRSGVFHYSYQDMVNRGLEPDIKKPYYTEYRPKEVVSRAKDMFAYAPLTNNHLLAEVDPHNFNHHAVGVIGENIVVKDLPDGEIGLFSKAVLYTQDGWDFYQSEGKELSGDYRSVVVKDTSGQYDYILKSIESVNSVALCPRGRAGPVCRINDSMGGTFLGGLSMAGRTGVLGFLGIGRTKDADFRLSKVVLDGAKTLHSLDAAGKEKLVGEIMSHIQDLSDGDTKETLIGAVKDSLSNPTEAVKQEEKVSKVIDGLYDACVATADKGVQELLKGIVKDEASEEAEKKKKEEEEKDKPTKDAAPLDMDKLIDAACEKMVTRVGDSIGDIIDKKVKEALGVKEEPKPAATKDEAGDFDPSEASFLLQNCFGGR